MSSAGVDKSNLLSVIFVVVGGVVHDFCVRENLGRFGRHQHGRLERSCSVKLEADWRFAEHLCHILRVSRVSGHAIFLFVERVFWPDLAGGVFVPVEVRPFSDGRRAYSPERDSAPNQARGRFVHRRVPCSRRHAQVLVLFTKNQKQLVG